MDPTLPLTGTTTMEAFLDRAMGADRFRGVLLLAFAGLGLALAAVGIYGVTARGVAERTREMGVRLALGSGRPALWRMVLRQALGSVAVGLALGPPATFLIVRASSHWLPVGSGADLWLAAPATALLAICAFASAAVPAWRAASLDPLEALRAD